MTASICRIDIKHEQIDTCEKICKLEDYQLNEISTAIHHKIEIGKITVNNGSNLTPLAQKTTFEN
jgi:hypothetical protein